MSTKLSNIKASLKNGKNHATFAIAIGIVVVIVVWIIEIILHADSNSIFKNIVQVHLTSPSIFLVDLLPVLLGVGVLQFYKIREKDYEILNKEIEQLDERINRNAEFAKQIGKGDFKSDFKVEDEEDVLANSLLIMKDNLLSNSKKEAEQNWIAQGKDIISNILRLHNKTDELAYEVIVNLINYIKAIQGALYIYNEEKESLINLATYAYNRKKYINQEFKVGRGLIGQCAYEMDIIYRTEIPDDYMTITSGILGDKKPKSILIVPLISDEKLQGVIEFASLEEEIPSMTIKFLKELGEIIARTLYNLSINQKTEKLLQESQQMTEELRENEEQLRQNAEEMRATQEELQKSNEKLETQIIEVENAQKRLYSLLENASEIISIYDENMRMTYISPSVIKILGFSMEEMMSGKDIDRLSRKGESDFKDMFNKLIDKPEESVSIQYIYMKKNGKKIYLETTGRNLLKDPAINGIILNSQDITERKRAEKEERMKSKMQSLSENSLDMIIRLNTVGQFFYANPVVEDYIGLKPSDIINKRLIDVQINEILENYFKDTIKEIKQEPAKRNHELTIKQTVKGKTITRIMRIDAIPEFNENELETILFVGHDITEAKRIEQEIKEKNKKIEDSINYAERIQTSILPDNRLIREYLPKSFILYKPRDVISGDFPWFFEKGDEIYIAAVDCTGHGVPGALLSFIGYFILNNVVDHDRELSAAEVCDMLHYGVRRTLKQDREDANSRDGMDIALCKINKKNKVVDYSGAHRPLYYIRDGKLTEYKGDRKAIGGIPHKKKQEKNFTNYKINYQPGDKLFFFSDGLPDQLGGPDKKKYSPARVREGITSHLDFTMPQYSQYFEQDFKEWLGTNKQIDDILLIGIEF